MAHEATPSLRVRNGLAAIGAVLAILFSSSIQARDLKVVPVVIAGSPESGVARLTNGTGSHCTAVLISDQEAVTAAHCLYNFRSQRWIKPAGIHLLFGFDRGDYNFHTLIAEYRTGRYQPEEPRETASEDWALLRLAAAPPKRFARLSLFSGAATDRRFHMIGFAVPKKYVLSRFIDCVARDRGGLIGSQCPAVSGMSGAPLIDDLTNQVLGIQIGSLKIGDWKELLGVPAAAWR